MAGKQGVTRLLTRHRASLVRDLDTNKILPLLVAKEVISTSEEQQVLAVNDPRERTEALLDTVGKRGLGAFHDFCSCLEKVAPHLLTGFLLDNSGECHVWCFSWCGVLKWIKSVRIFYNFFFWNYPPYSTNLFKKNSNSLFLYFHLFFLLHHWIPFISSSCHQTNWKCHFLKMFSWCPTWVFSFVPNTANWASGELSRVALLTTVLRIEQ